MSAGIRTFHRWTSIIFTGAVLINTVAAVLKMQAVWVGLMALVPLILLIITGLYMFFRPYFARERHA
jgi:uncharacterized membrane-anchored protein